MSNEERQVESEPVQPESTSNQSSGNKNNMWFIAVIVVLIIASFFFFNKDKQSEETAEESNSKESGQEINDNQMETNNEVTELKIETLKEGEGEAMTKVGDSISVHYTGTLLDGTKFDSSLDRSEPFIFTIGQGMVIEGWDKGLLDMKVGEQRKLTIPADMAYGERGAGAMIPPNSPLVFETELISIN